MLALAIDVIGGAVLLTLVLMSLSVVAGLLGKWPEQIEERERRMREQESKVLLQRRKKQ